MGVTIYNVAKKAGVSTCWVSFVLRDHPRAKEVSQEVRDRIRNAAAELGYHRNVSAATISNGFNSSTIAMLVPGNEVHDIRYMYPRYFETIRYFNLHGFGIRTYCDENMDKVLPEIASNQIRYVVCCRLEPEKRDLCAAFCRKHGLKAAFQDDRREPYPDFLTFGSDDRSMTAEMVDYLYKLGHRRIGMALGQFAYKSNEQRYEGWLRGMAQHGLSGFSDLYFNTDGFSEQVLLNFLREKRPTAIIAAGSELAVRIIHFLRFYRIPVPQSVSLMSFGWEPKLDFYLPRPLTSMRELLLEQGNEKILQYFQGKLPAETHSVFFGGRMFEGGTTAPPPGDFSWLERLPVSIEVDREWFPDNENPEQYRK